jgi:crossover junction endodeoxyribonuclease RusA
MRTSWTGSNNCRFVALRDGTLVIELASMTSQRSHLRALVRDTLVNGGWCKAARFDGYEVNILLQVDQLSRRIDADNVAKALLDALTGLIWQDDRQIRRLLVEKEQGAGPAITLMARKHEAGTLKQRFAELLP